MSGVNGAPRSTPSSRRHRRPPLVLASDPLPRTGSRRHGRQVHHRGDRPSPHALPSLGATATDTCLLHHHIAIRRVRNLQDIIEVTRVLFAPESYRYPLDPYERFWEGWSFSYNTCSFSRSSTLPRSTSATRTGGSTSTSTLVFLCRVFLFLKSEIMFEDCRILFLIMYGLWRHKY
ncbi:uncharacterized protein LOC123443197 isoform X1 [Hordeum vulgare subsp. vulgare]|uniref:uncharacterized protein LOC123443197 isoform X1 n=1 Tax=Hordeum vulgare subsp. vulgare TaxID=112509 RepID=UPI001D1A3A3E|nr:uncharacterized protein LOC123443197 isoform X1 [Hordeum vulgare subsp. vulgare]